MSKEQIKKLTSVLWLNPYVRLDSHNADMLAQYLTNEGYRKQSDWISVDERMPEDDLPKDTDRRTIRCLVATNKGTVKACVRQRYISPSNGKLTPWCWSKDVYAKPTHWMPLPEPPKGE